MRQPTNHRLHGTLTFLTLGYWAAIWLFAAAGWARTRRWMWGVAAVLGVFTMCVAILIVSGASDGNGAPLGIWAGICFVGLSTLGIRRAIAVQRMRNAGTWQSAPAVAETAVVAPPAPTLKATPPSGTQAAKNHRRTAITAPTPSVHLEDSLVEPAKVQVPTAPPGRSTKPRRGAADWVPFGGSFVIDGQTISGGLVYFGRQLSSLAAYSGVPDPALIDPSLRVNRRQPDNSGTDMTYWPSYSSISAEARGAYLNWLAGGRRSPGTYIGYVFLFFYGLERHLLHDKPSEDEQQAIVDEVRQLLEVYGENSSFRAYAGSLIDFVTPVDVVTTPPQFASRSWELPFPLRAGLGALVRDGKAIPAEWALAWARLDPETHMRTPANRCRAQFDKLFVAEYAESFGEGIRIKPPARRLRFEYRPASASFRGTQWVIETELPDVASITGPRNKLRKIVDSCCDQLDAYSRWIGRHPDDTESIAAVCLLPASVMETVTSSAFDRLRSTATEVVGNQDRAIVAIDRLVDDWPDSAKLPKSQAVQLSHALARCNLGIEPDVRFGGSTLTRDQDVLLFRLSSMDMASPSREFLSVVTFLVLAALVAHADGTFDASERALLDNHVEQAPGLSEAERCRLGAKVELLAHVAPSTTGMKKNVAALSEPDRQLLSRSLIAVAGADGRVTGPELRQLEKLYVVLGLRREQLHADMHTLAAAPDSPVPVTTARPSTGYQVPPQPAAGEAAPADRAVTLDMGRVEATLAESNALSGRLGDIFGDEEIMDEVDGPDPIEDEGGTTAIAGLDAPHTGLVMRVIEQSSMTRGDLERLAAEFDLLPDGAVETINEASFEACGEPLLEGDEPIEVNEYAAKELVSA